MGDSNGLLNVLYFLVFIEFLFLGFGFLGFLDFLAQNRQVRKESLRCFLLLPPDADVVLRSHNEVHLLQSFYHPISQLFLQQVGPLGFAAHVIHFL